MPTNMVAITATGTDESSSALQAIAAGHGSGALHFPSRQRHLVSVSLFRSPTKRTSKSKDTSSRHSLPSSPISSTNHPTFCSPKRLASRTRAFLYGALRPTVDSSRETTPNVIQLLGGSCPDDLLPLVLSFAGPKTALSLSQTCTRWRDVMSQESTWKVLSEQLSKWTESDEVPPSWKDYYCLNPIVPTDFSSVHKAVKSATLVAARSQCNTIRILCQPGSHQISKPITLFDSTVSIFIETLRVPTSMDGSAVRSCLREPARAVFVQRLDVHRPNEPMFRVVAGTSATLSNISIHHHAVGSDIWNGNAAIHIYGPGALLAEEQVKPAHVSLRGVEISSSTGRGIVLAADGATLDIKDSCIHSCAGTGLYIAGERTTTRVDSTDIVFNGRGNVARGGVIPGHSGVYIEKGAVFVSNCNVSANIGRGITIMPPGGAKLDVQDSDVVMNGVDALETLSRGLAQHETGLQINANKRLSKTREERSRSSIMHSIR